MNQATKKNLKQFLIVLSLLTAIIAAVVSLYLSTRNFRVRKMIKSYTDIQVPNNANVICYKKSVYNNGAHYYIVFAFEDEPETWIRETGFCRYKNYGIEQYFTNKDGWINGSVEEKYHLSFYSDYYWIEKHSNKDISNDKDDQKTNNCNSKAFIVYLTANNTLTVDIRTGESLN